MTDELAAAGLDPALLAPLPGRAVEPLADHDRITEARRDENAALPQGVWVRPVKQADWALVERLCTDVLVMRAKDLRVAGWLAEAWVQQLGFAGLHRGLLLLDRLCRDHWPDLFPALEPGDSSARVAPLEWLAQRLPVVLRLVPIVLDPAQPDICFGWWHWLEAQRLDGIRRQNPAAAQRAEAGGTVTLAMFAAAQARTDGAQLAAQSAALGAALAALARLDATLDDRCGADAPGLGRIRSLAIDIKAFIDAELDARVVAVIAPPPVARLVAPPAESTVAPAPMTRAAAYAQLAEIAAFLHASEPHSPVPHVLDLLVDWGGQSLPEIAAGLEASGGDLATLMASLGFQPDVRN